MRAKPVNEIAVVVIVACIVLALGAALVSAGVSSVDVYSGQAAVLGKQAHHHARTAALRTGTGGASSGAHGQGTAGASGSGSSGGAPSSSVAGSGRATGSGAAAGGSAQGAAAGAAPGRQGAVAASAGEAAGGLSVSGLDAFLLALVIAGLLGAGVLIRRLGRLPR